MFKQHSAVGTSITDEWFTKFESAGLLCLSVILTRWILSRFDHRHHVWPVCILIISLMSSFVPVCIELVCCGRSPIFLMFSDPLIYLLRILNLELHVKYLLRFWWHMRDNFVHFCYIYIPVAEWMCILCCEVLVLAATVTQGKLNSESVMYWILDCSIF